MKRHSFLHRNDENLQYQKDRPDKNLVIRLLYAMSENKNPTLTLANVTKPLARIVLNVLDSRDPIAGYLLRSQLP